MTAALIFLATFMVVFALGLQSLNVNGGHRGLAAATSLAIGTSNLVILQAVPSATEWLQFAAYLSGGPLGILASMHVHPWLARRLGRREQAGLPIDLGPIGGRGPLPTQAGAVGQALEQLARDLLDPDAFAHSVTPEVHARARRALGLQAATFNQHRTPR